MHPDLNELEALGLYDEADESRLDYNRREADLARWRREDEEEQRRKERAKSAQRKRARRGERISEVS